MFACSKNRFIAFREMNVPTQEGILSLDLRNSNNMRTKHKHAQPWP